MNENEKKIEDQSFYNEALTGSGTITEDGTYADPEPDPTVKRGLGGTKTSGGREVLTQGLGDESAVSNLSDSGEKPTSDEKPARPVQTRKGQ